MCGRKVKFSDMFGDKSFDSEEVNGITFESGYDDNENTYRDLLQEKLVRFGRFCSFLQCFVL